MDIDTFPSKKYRNIGGFPKDSCVDFVEIPLTGDAILHFKAGHTESTKGYNMDICERFVTQGKWEVIP
jgi:hypothetical protein